METGLAILIILGLFLLRFAGPMALTFLFGYGMNRLVERWHISPES